MRGAAGEQVLVVALAHDRVESGPKKLAGL